MHDFNIQFVYIQFLKSSVHTSVWSVTKEKNKPKKNCGSLEMNIETKLNILLFIDGKSVTQFNQTKLL